MAQLTRLFQPGKIGKMELRNRIVMPPMATSTAEQGYPSPRMIDYYVARAKGGVGLIIAGVCMFMPGATAPQQLALNEDKYIPALKKLTDAVHEYGAKIAIQFNHIGRAMALARYSPSEERRKNAISPSPVPLPSGAVPREATLEEIARIVDACSEAARRAKDAGFDAVEIHAAHGYLLGSFLSPATNKRTDAYGGNTENRARFVCEIVKRSREKAGTDFPISVRFSGCDYVLGGITLEEALKQAPLFVKAGADVLHVSASAAETLHYQFVPFLLPSGLIVHLAEAVKKVVNVPVITVGKLGDPVLANKVIEEGKADFVAMGRPLLADAELPNKAREGRLEEITRCLYCNTCWSLPREKMGGLRCSVNPALLREADFVLKPAKSAKKVMVIGGGVGGMEASRTLAERGHNVTLYERDDKLGGQWNIVALQEFKEPYSDVSDRLSRGLRKSGANVILNKEVTPELVKNVKPDAVVVATGAVPLTPNILGIENKNVVQANDVITGKTKVGDKVVVIGGRLIGMEVADYLAGQGKNVTIVTRGRMGGSREPVPDSNAMRVLMGRFAERGVSLYPYSQVYEIRDNGVYIDYDRGILLGLLFLKADSVVLAVGSQPQNSLAEELKGLAPEVYKIGDCVEPRSAMEAIREGAEIARQI